MILSLIILLVLIIYLFFSLAEFYNILVRGYAPLVSTDRKTIKKIIQEVEIKEQAVVYELGCGQARFLRIIAKSFPKTKLVGVENLFDLYFINKIKFKLLKIRIKLIKQDFFRLNLREANLIYCYLNNKTMLNLGEKFSRECQRGTQIISRSFPIPQFKPEKVLLIKNKKIYFYKI